MQLITKGLALAFALLLAGCAGVRIPGLPELLGADPEQQQVLELLGYAQRVTAMSADQQRRAYGVDNQAFATEKNAYNRLRLALLLATPGASVRDDARAAGLLEPLAAQDETTSPMHRLASVMYAQIAERQREQKRHEQMRQQIEAERQREHKQAEQLRQQIEVERQREHKQVEQLRQQMEAERQREQKQVEQLRQQIEALKSVERAITERVQQGQPRRQ